MLSNYTAGRNPRNYSLSVRIPLGAQRHTAPAPSKPRVFTANCCWQATVSVILTIFHPLHADTLPCACVYCYNCRLSVSTMYHAVLCPHAPFPVRGVGHYCWTVTVSVLLAIAPVLYNALSATPNNRRALVPMSFPVAPVFLQFRQLSRWLVPSAMQIPSVVVLLNKRAVHGRQIAFPMQLAGYVVPRNSVRICVYARPQLGGIIQHVTKCLDGSNTSGAIYCVKLQYSHAHQAVSAFHGILRCKYINAVAANVYAFPSAFVAL